MPRAAPLSLPFYNSTNYPLAVGQQLSALDYTEEEKARLKFHQFIPKEFFTRVPGIRGLLVVHETGQGKTRVAVSIAEYFAAFHRDRRIILLMPKSLHENFRTNIKAYSHKPDEYIDSTYRFVSLNAATMFQQMASVDKAPEEVEYERRLGRFMDDVQKNDSLENSLLVVDEAHNLFNGITNGAKNAVALYDLIMRSTTCKLLFLTGTPVINDPFELVPCFNMLRGLVRDVQGRLPAQSKHNDFRKGISGGHTTSTFGGRTTSTFGGHDYDTMDNYTNEFQTNLDEWSDEIDKKTMTDDIITHVYETTADKLSDDTIAEFNEPIGGHTDEQSISDADEREDSDDKNDSDSEPNDAEQDVQSDNEPQESEQNIREIEPEEQNVDDDIAQNKQRPRNFARRERAVAQRPADYHELFSEDADEFNEFFVDRKNSCVKNRDKFKARIFGLSSYYGDLYFPHGETKVGFPKRLPTVVERVPMSPTQYARYALAAEQEAQESKGKFKRAAGRFSSAKGGQSTYRVKTRQISNYCIPEYALGPARGHKQREKFVNRISQADLLDTDKYSPKFSRIIANIYAHDKQPGLVYSQFVSGEGCAVFARVLEAHGWIDVTDPRDAERAHRDMHDVDPTITSKAHHRPTFAQLTGEISPDDRATIIARFNQRDNADGSVIRILLLSGAVAEGIDLKRGRHTHIMEPFWNAARIKQVEARVIRLNSHADLPEDQQNVQPYIYLSDYPADLEKKASRELTTDVSMYTKSVDNMRVIDDFMRAVAESSVDCQTHSRHFTPEIAAKIKCMVCAPTNVPLFHAALRVDMRQPSTCREPTTSQVQAVRLQVPTHEMPIYYDRQNKTKIYIFDPKLKGYRLLTTLDRGAADLYDAVVAHSALPAK